MPKLTDYQWELVRQGWEAGESKSALSRNFGVATTTISNRQKAEAWSLNEITKPGAEAERVVFSDLPDLPAETPITPQRVADVAETIEAAETATTDAEQAIYIAKLEEKVKALESRVESLRETVDIAIYSTPEEVVQVLGDAALEEMALGRFAQENVKRFRQGYPPLDYRDRPDIFDAEITKIKDELVRERTSHIDLTRKLRVVKMVHPNGNLVQIPFEEQINNMKGEPMAPMAKIRAKGFKLCEPYLCQLLDCWLPSPRNDDQTFVHQGYCSAGHMAHDPYIAGRKVEGVSTSDTSRLAGGLPG